MPELNEFSLIETVRDTAKFADKIDQLLKAKTEAEEAQKAAKAAQAQLAKFRTETDNYVNGRKAELSAQQLLHDTAAKEAADRIEVGKNQMAEALRVQDENKQAALALAARETDLTRREKLLKDQRSGIAQRLADLDRAADLIRRQQDHIAAMPKA